jgi:hypothetical protein
MTTNTIDLKREHREWYTALATPVIVEVPEFAFVMIDGRGDPNTSPEFAAAIPALYQVSYGIKFALAGATPPRAFTVMPLEGQFWMPDVGGFDASAKDRWCWTLMIRQPDEVTASEVTAAARAAAKRHPSDAIESLRFERFAEGLAAQVLHRGPYAEEGPTIATLHRFIHDNGWDLTGRHHEIYLSDPRRSAPATMKTILRQPVVRALESDG